MCGTKSEEATWIDDIGTNRIPNGRVGVDIIEVLPTTPGGNRFVMVVVDYFTKWLEAYAIPNQIEFNEQGENLPGYLITIDNYYYFRCVIINIANYIIAGLLTSLIL